MAKKFMTAEIFDRICDEIEAGHSVNQICRSSWAPARSAFYRYVDAGGPEVQDKYRDAMMRREEVIFDQILEIADNPQRGEKRKILVRDDQDTDEGQVIEVTEGDMVEHRKLQLHARMWVLGRLNPKKYGDRQQVDHSGELSLKSVPERMARAKARLADGE